MSKRTDTSLFIFSPWARYAVEFYQQLLRRTDTYEQFCNRLILLGEHAHSLRQFEKVNEIGLLLSNVPISRYQAIGYYFLAVAANNVGNGDQDKAQELFELVVDTAPDKYKVKSILSLGAVAGNKGDIDSAFYFYQGVAKREGLSPCGLQAMRGIAVLKAVEGYHESAIVDLENILPAFRYTAPYIYLDCLNSYAVELIEAKRPTEAENVSLSVVTSPFAPYYPEWRETREDIRNRQASRSNVTFSAAIVPETTNLLHMPMCEGRISPPESFTAQQRAAVLDMQAWKNRKMTDKDERRPKPATSDEKQARLKELEKLRGREILVHIMTALGDEGVEDDKLRKALVVLEGLDEG